MVLGVRGKSTIYPLHTNSFWLYYWHRNRIGDHWWYSRSRDVAIHIDREDGRYFVEIFDQATHISIKLDQKWRTLRTAKKWGLVRGLDREWMDKAIKEHCEGLND